MTKELNYSPQSAVTELSETFRKTKLALARRKTGNYLILWGITISAGYLASWILKNIGKNEILSLVWGVAIIIGILGTTILTVKRVNTAKDYFPEGKYIWPLWLSLAIYSILLFAIIIVNNHSLSPIKVSLYWLNFAMLGYVLMGIFLGIELAILGISISVISILCALFLQNIFDFAMALICLICFVGGGIYINKKWVL